jgi:hypothetical protein
MGWDGAAGVERSNSKSFEALGGGGCCFGCCEIEEVWGREEKPVSQPFEEMDAVRGAAGSLGVEVLEAMLSNKLPVGDVTLEEDCGPPNPVNPAKASACGFGGGGDAEFVGNVRPLKASVKEPTFDWLALAIEDVRSCWAGWGFGAVAYRDRMDCFKSGRDIPACEPAVGPVLPGRLVGVDCVLPKKSNPSNESAGFACFGAADCCALAGGGGRATAGGPVVLGRAGGLIVLSSSKKLTDCCCA